MGRVDSVAAVGGAGTAIATVSCLMGAGACIGGGGGTNSVGGGATIIPFASLVQMVVCCCSILVLPLSSIFGIRLESAAVARRIQCC